MHILGKFFPNWRDLRIHESSPTRRGASQKLAAECPMYIETQYDAGVKEGEFHPTSKWRCENLERQTFPNESFDLVITQDVFEHLFDPVLAIREIARTLKKTGAHICTTPLVRGVQSTIVCAERDADGLVIHHVSPDYHSNPVDPLGSLVTYWWGYDIADLFDTSTELNTTIAYCEIPSMGVEGPLTEVLLSIRSSGKEGRKTQNSTQLR